MSTFPLPPHDQPGLDLLLNRDLWSRWQADGVVFPLESFRAACRYFRFKPDTTSRLYVAGVDQQSASEPPEGIMLHIFPDAERARVAYAKEMSKRHKIGTGGYQPFLCEESCIVGIPYPNDPEIPDLRHLYSPDSFRRTLEDLLADYPREQWRIQRSLTRLTLLNYKPGRRAVYRVKVKIRRREGDEKVRVRLHVKVENPRSADRSHQNLLQVHSALPDGSPWRVPSPRGRIDSRALMAAEWVEGTPLREIASSPEKAGDAFHAVGAALASFHRLPVDFDHLPSPVEESDSLSRHGKDLALLLPEKAAQIERLSERIAMEVSRLALSPSAPIHNDFHLDQVLISESGPVLVDLDRSGVGYAASDVGTFLASLDENRVDSALGAEFLRGYEKSRGEPLPADWIRLSRAIATFRRAGFPFRDLDPDWPLRLAERMEETRLLLEELDR